MQATKRVVVRGVPAVALFLISLVLAGCGGSGSNPTPQGGFTNASVNGAYAISFSGSDVAGFFAVSGSIQVDGAGHITGGTLDVNRLGANGLPQPVSTNSVSGNYAVRADGRSVATLNSPAGNFALTFVIISGQRTLVTVFQGNTVGGGSMDLQNASAFSTSAVAGTFAFSVSGADSTGRPVATVGSWTANAAGSITTGVEDTADNGAITQNVAITGGSLAVASNGRGTLSVTTASGTSTFIAYVVDTDHMKLVQVDTSGTQLAGDAFRQPATLTNASLSGPFAFTVAGSDIAFGPSSVGGVFNSNGGGAITGGTLDFNTAGSALTGDAILATSTYSIAGVRGTLTLQSAQATTNFVIYPTTSGMELLEVDNGFVVSGGAFQQTGPFSNGSISGTYGLAFNAAAMAEIDADASLRSDGAGHLSGIIDINNGGSTSTGTPLNGNYSVGVDGRGPFSIQTGLGPQNMAVYVINSNRALFMEVDANAVAVGEILHQ